jgi:hypothetical protein
MILNEREYNRRAKNKADLGVRVQTSNKSDPTAKLAVERVMIREAIGKIDIAYLLTQIYIHMLYHIKIISSTNYLSHRGQEENLYDTQHFNSFNNNYKW